MTLNKIIVAYSAIVMVLMSASCTNADKPTSQAETPKIIPPVNLVYPQLDTENSRWFLFSSACRPFGMVNLSPDTQLNGTWGSGYRHEVDTVKGFSHIHGWQLSGLSVMPVSVAEENKSDIYSDFYSKFNHDEEQITPGHHTLKLQRYNIDVELTSTKRVGFHKYTFPSKANKAILFNLNSLLGPCETTDGTLKQTTENTIQGEFTIAPTKRRPKPVKVFYHAVLNTPIQSIDQDEKSGNYLVLVNDETTAVSMKIGLSYTSIENAEINLNTEIPNWNFDQIVSDSKSEWNSHLSKIEIEGGSTKDQRRFYTDLWHALQGRRTISDVNGAYPDNTGETFRVGQLPLKPDGTPLHNHYNSDSFWGAQWTINTLWGLVYPEIKKDFALSLLQYGKDGGLIPRGPSGGNYTYVMTGASSTPFIVSAVQEGLLTHDLENIYTALKKNHMPNGIMEKAGYEHNTNIGGGFKYYLEKGYVPYPLPEGKFGLHQDGASLTMEYAYQDFTLAQLAKKLGHDDDYTYFMKRSKNYKNVFDASVGWMRPKNVKGEWLKDFDPYLYENGFNESNGAQSTWFVPHDLDGLAELFGGKEKAVEKLNKQFKEAEKIGFTAGTSHDREMHPEYSRIPINYGNQPAIQTAFIFNQLGRPDLTQYWSKKVVEQVFSGLSPATGYNGDEDQGLMGSLSVLMKMGLFQMKGGTDENPEYQIGNPIFDKITIHLNNTFYQGKTIEINNSNSNSQEDLTTKLFFNNKPVDHFIIQHQDLVKGGVLNLENSIKEVTEQH